MSPRRCGLTRGPKLARAALDGHPSTGTALGVAQRRAASGREEGSVARVLGRDASVGSNRATRGRRHVGRRRFGENAARQMLEHLALEAVVIERMSRTAWDAGSIFVMVGGRSFVRFDARAALRDRVLVRQRFHRDPRQRTERGPGERNERIAGDPRLPARATQSAPRRAEYR
jgi:hypothetical protein